MGTEESLPLQDAPPDAPPGSSTTENIVPTLKNDMFYTLWDKFSSKPTQPAVASLDRDIENHPSHHVDLNEMGLISRENATTSFEKAKQVCEEKVSAIVKECKRLNLKYTDPTFRIGQFDTLASLKEEALPVFVNPDGTFIGSVKRIADIFEQPEFIIDGTTANDIRQGQHGDCWFVAAVTALTGTEEKGQELQLLQKLCIARDEKVGVYGFVFHRDGEWISEIVDDRLCLTQSVEFIEKQPEKVRPYYSTGSDALYFSSCKGSNETWLPLLEKAFAKAHGDYQSIAGGFAGEGIEDLTGGVNVSIDTEDILDTDVLWQELKRVNRDFLFGCSSRRGLDPNPEDAEGFIRSHAYTVLEAREVQNSKPPGERLLKLRNPWGAVEWNGRYSDGSKEWTPELMKELNHQFDDDGLFWICLKDYLRCYRRMDRTRLFGPEWTVTQQWTSVEVPYKKDYLSTHFTLDVTQPGPIVLVLAKPDERYFVGLEGRYNFQLHFRLYREGEKTFLLRSISGSGLGRSCSAELDAEEGRYMVHIKIAVDRYDDNPTTDEIIRMYGRERKDKVLAVGKSFDRIHSKGKRRQMEEEVLERTKTESKMHARQKKVVIMKAERASKKEERRKEKLRVKRIEIEMARKKSVKKAAKAKEAKETAPTAGGTDEDVKPVTTEESVQDKSPSQTDEPGTSEEPGKPETPSEAEKPEKPTMPEQPKESVPESTNDGKPAAIDAEETAAAGPPSKGDPATNGPPSADGDPDKNDDKAESSDDDTVSAVCDDDFDWNSDLDGPVDPVEIPAESDSDDDHFANDPWNAICVVGLRVYFKSGEAKIGVVKG